MLLAFFANGIADGVGKTIQHSPACSGTDNKKIGKTGNFRNIQK
jgi:hypothetical protein